MKQATITTILIFILFFSCRKEAKLPPREKISCDFGITQFNYTKRTKEEVAELNRKTKPPHPTHPHDTTVVEPPPPPPPPPPSPYNGMLLVDFDGGFVDDPTWGTFTVVGSGLTDVQKAEIFSSVEFDYSAFNVLVTTDESLFNSFVGKKNICYVTETYEWYGSSGGVALIGSFNSDQSPCFVFSLLLNYNTKFIKEAVSHELGHTIGLLHYNQYDADCNYIGEYSYGCCGNAHIMGVGYYQPNVCWYISELQACTPNRNDSLYIKSIVGVK